MKSGYSNERDFIDIFIIPENHVGMLFHMNFFGVTFLNNR